MELNSTKLEKNQSLRKRVICLGLVLIPINGWWLIQMEEFRYSGHPTPASLFFNVIFLLSLLTLFNLVVTRFIPKVALSQAELLTLYVMLSIASAISDHEQLIGYRVSSDTRGAFLDPALAVSVRQKRLKRVLSGRI